MIVFWSLRRDEVGFVIDFFWRGEGFVVVIRVFFIGEKVIKEDEVEILRGLGVEV